MFRYEIKKLLQRKVNLIAMLVGYVILMITTIYPVVNDSEYIDQENKELQGVAAMQYREEMAKSQTAELTEPYLTGILQEIQDSGIDPNSDEGYLYFVGKYGSLYQFLLNSYQPIGDGLYQQDILSKVDIKNGAQFYERRVQRVKDYVDQDFSFGNYTPAEKAYWVKKAESVKTPFAWGDTSVAGQYGVVFGVGFYLLFVLIVCLAPMFAGEREQGIEGLLLATKHGQRRLIAAKIWAAYGFSFAYVLTGYVISCIWLYVTIGMRGLTLPVQLLDSAICSSMNLGQYLLLYLALCMAFCFFETTVVLFFSALTRSSIGTMALLFTAMLVPVFIPVSKESRLCNHVLALAMVRLLDLKRCLATFMDYRIGPFIIDLPAAGILVHLGIAVVLALILRKIYVSRALAA